MRFDYTSLIEGIDSFDLRNGDAESISLDMSRSASPYRDLGSRHYLIA